DGVNDAFGLDPLTFGNSGEQLFAGDGRRGRNFSFSDNANFRAGNDRREISWTAHSFDFYFLSGVKVRNRVRADTDINASVFVLDKKASPRSGIGDHRTQMNRVTAFRFRLR